MYTSNETMARVLIIATIAKGRAHFSSLKNKSSGQEKSFVSLFRRTSASTKLDPEAKSYLLDNHF